MDFDLFAAIYTDNEMTTAEFLASVVRMARDRLEAEGMDPGAAYEAVLLAVAIDFPAVILTALTGHNDNDESENFLEAVLAATRTALAGGGGKRSRPRRLDA